MDVTVSTTGFNYMVQKSYFESKHKSRPSQFSSIVQGRIKRSERKSLHRKSARITTFDNARNFSPLAIPAPTHNSNQAKSNRRRLLLLQWKEEKEKKKQEHASTKKKKPFLVGAIRAPPSLECLPSVPKSSMVGRVTRSQATKNKSAPAAASKSAPSTSAGRVVMTSADFFAKTSASSQQRKVSFAPPNAVFHPPQNLSIRPVVSTMGKGKIGPEKMVRQSFTFEPVLKSTQLKKMPKHQTIQPEKVSESRVWQNNHNKPKSVSQTTQAKHVVQPKAVKHVVHHKAAGLNDQSQSAGALAPKDTDRNVRATRRNNRLLDKDKTNELKVTQAKDKDQKSINTDKEKPSGKKSTLATAKTKTVLPRGNNKENTVLSHTTLKKSTPKSESRLEEKLRSPPQEKSLTPEQIRVEVAAMSPCVTVSRGKKNARMESMAKLKDGLLADDVGDEKNVDHFRSQLNSEIKRLTAICDAWHKYAEDHTLPENIQELVLAAVGQTRLLMSKKLQQFSQLVEQCASGERRPEGCITVADLQGFWDMVFMQVDNVDMRFKQLSELRERQWASEDKPQPKKKRPAAGKAKSTVAAAAGATSKIRAMIEAARRANQTAAAAPTNVLLGEPEPAGHKDFDAGFFTVTSPVRARTPRRNASLLRDVLSSEARKATATGKDSASRAMMRASIIAKTLDHDVVPDEQTTTWVSPPAINLEATPARSILKTPNIAARASVRRKSAKTVLFFNADEPLEKPQPSSPTAGIEVIVATPEKTSEHKAANRGSITKRNRKPARSSAMDQENVAPEGSPPRRVTRGMRRSSVQESLPRAVTPATAGRPARATRTSTRLSSRLAEVH